MRNKSIIIILTVLVSALSLYFLSFTLVSKGVQEDAEAYATVDGKLDARRKQYYLDSVWKAPVHNFLGAEYTYQEVKENELNLGLDLKGGMHVTLEVSPVEIIKAMAGNSKDPQFQEALKRATQMQRNSQDKFTTLFAQAYREVAPDGRLARIFSNSANKGRINFDSSNDQVISVIDEEVEGAIDRSFNILRTRIDKFGVNQPNIQRLKGTGRIQIELPGVDNPDRVRKLLQGMANLEFWEVWRADEFGPYLEQLNNYMVKAEAAGKIKGTETPETTDALAEATLQDSAAAPADSALASADTTASLDKQLAATTDKDTAKTDTANAQQSSQLAKLFTMLPDGIGSNLRDTARVNALLSKPEVRAIFPPNLQFLWGVKPIKGDNNQEFLTLYPIRKGRMDAKAPVSGEYVSDARQDFDQNGQPEVNMSMNVTGAKKWQKLTADNIDRQIAIVLDNYVYSAPVVKNEIAGGNSSISGSFTIEEAQDLANILKAGKMPAPTRIVEEAIVGPSLGQEAISQGLLSTLAALAVVVLFMIFYYSKGGLIADIALFVNVFFILGMLAQLKAALTLPGIAGIVLTLGMAVDANVLIFERIREELRNGLSYKDAIRKGFDKAFWSIFDANVTTLIAGIILYYFGSGPVKGFAITLMLGIATSFFTSVFISRLIVEAMIKNTNGENISFKSMFTKGFFLNTNYQIVNKRKMAYIFSTVIIALGFVAMAIKGGPNLGVDFKGGRSYVVDFSGPVSSADVRSAVMDDFKNAGTEVKTFGADNRIKVITSYLADDESTQADEQVKTALESGLKEFASLKPTINSSSKVGATMADDIQKTALIAILLSFIGISLYVMLRFTKWQYSLGGVVALIHDTLMVIAFYAIAHLFGLSFEMDQIFIAAILTIIGFSINDTVVIYDRIREYTHMFPRMPLDEVINKALNSTFSRTVITSLTVLLVSVILFIFGGEVLRGFSFAMIVGIIAGTYSSLFIAAPILIDTTKNKTEAVPVTGKVAPEKVRTV